MRVSVGGTVCACLYFFIYSDVPACLGVNARVVCVCLCVRAKVIAIA